MTKILKFSFLILIIVSCTETKQADLIIHNAKIYTVNDLFDIAEAMVITDGKIIAIGTEHEIRNKYNAKKIIDAQKQTIYPGFIDAHCHFVEYALNLKKVNLIDHSVDLVNKVIPQTSKKTIEIALLNAQHHLFAAGLTTVDDAGLSKDNIELIDKLQQENKLKLKVYAMITGNEEMLTYYLKKGPYKTEMLTVCSFKFYADGRLGSRGISLTNPYSDIIESEHYGLLINQADFFNKYAPLIYEKGFQMNTHCIEDSANRLILDVYAKVLKGVNDKRWRIEHAQIIHPNDFEKFKNYTIIPSIQPTYATSDMYWAKDSLGKNSVKGAYAYKGLLKQNGIVALGTDFTVEGISPIKTFYAAVVKKDKESYPKNENALSRQEALKGMTIWAAIANFEENEKGSLEVGKSADFVILNNDLMTIDQKKILNIKVVQTFINGENVFTLKK